MVCRLRISLAPEDTETDSRKQVRLDSDLIKDDDPHDFALDDDDAALVVDAHAARVLQDVGAKLADELAVLVVDLDLEFRCKPKH